MFEINEELAVKVESALAVLRKYRRGDCVPHSELSSVLGLVPEPGGDYYRIVRKAREQLRDTDGIWSHPDATEGFLLLTEDETLVQEQKRRSKRARKQIGIGLKAAVMINPDGLSMRKRMLREAVIENAKELRRKLTTREAKASQFMQPFRESRLRAMQAAAVQQQS